MWIIWTLVHEGLFRHKYCLISSWLLNMLANNHYLFMVTLLADKHSLNSMCFIRVFFTWDQQLNFLSPGSSCAHNLLSWSRLVVPVNLLSLSLIKQCRHRTVGFDTRLSLRLQWIQPQNSLLIKISIKAIIRCKWSIMSFARYVLWTQGRV